MFHYQVGSLEEEPAVLAAYLSRQGRAQCGRGARPLPRRPALRRVLRRGLRRARHRHHRRGGGPAPGRGRLAHRGAPAVGEPDGLVYLGLGVAARAVALAVESEKWDVPVVANSALMFGYGRRDWRAGWDGWVYVDTVSNDNAMRAALREHSPRSSAGPIGVAAYDMGRLVGEAVARAAHLTRDGVRDGLERVKQLPATSGMDGTTMGFGHYDHGALKGRYLVLRQWLDGKTVQVDEP